MGYLGNVSCTITIAYGHSKRLFDLLPVSHFSFFQKILQPFSRHCFFGGVGVGHLNSFGIQGGATQKISKGEAGSSYTCTTGDTSQIPPAPP